MDYSDNEFLTASESDEPRVNQEQVDSEDDFLTASDSEVAANQLVDTIDEHQPTNIHPDEEAAIIDQFLDLVFDDQPERPRERRFEENLENQGSCLNDSAGHLIQENDNVQDRPILGSSQDQSSGIQENENDLDNRRTLDLDSSQEIQGNVEDGLAAESSMVETGFPNRLSGRSSNQTTVTAEQNVDEYILLPRMEQISHGCHTARSIMRVKFRAGMPEDIILVFVKAALIELSSTYSNGHAHNRLSSGHMFLHYHCDSTSSIELARPAIIHEDREPPTGGWANPELVWEWAAAPEIRNSDLPATAKSDIWLVGVAALELAQGGLRYRDGNELDRVVKAMHCRHKIPRRRISLPFGCFPVELPNLVHSFSGRFHRVVLRCLEPNPDNRASAHDLLQEDAFTKLGIDADYVTGRVTDRNSRVSSPTV